MGVAYIKFMHLDRPESIEPILSHLTCLPIALQEKVKSFRFPRDAQLNMFGKLLLYEMGIELGLETNFLHHLKWTEFGRPYYEGNIDFNISHSGNCVMVGITQAMRIGVDIEHIRSIDIEDFRHFFSKTEVEEILSHSSPLTKFYEWWTRKEAVMKADGRGFSLDTASIRFTDNIANVEGDHWYVSTIDVLDNYACAITTNKEFDIGKCKIEQHFFCEV